MLSWGLAAFQMQRVLVVEEDQTARQRLQLKLRGEGYHAAGVASLEGAGRAAESAAFDFIVRRWPAEPGDGARLGDGPARRAKLILIVPAGSDPGPALAAMRDDGVHDFLFDAADLPEALALALKKAGARLEAAAPGGARRRPADGPAAAGAASSEMVGDSPQLAELMAAVTRMAAFKTTVLVRGESGTGKELVARALHRLSPRAAGPFVAVNCGAIPGGLMESELFGHMQGAFTDALRDREGLLEQASGGTLFLDEIAELPLALQVKLLRVLQDDGVRRLGDAEERAVDVRLVAATARDLEAEMAAGRFREDLFYRLNVLSLRLPPLRERAADIPSLAAHFMARINQRLGLAVRTIDAEALRILVAYPWPGNVRQLENTIERACVMCEGEAIDAASLPGAILERIPGGAHSPASPTAAAGLAPPAGGGEEDLSIKRAARRGEEALIRRALARTGGNRTRAAALLEISHRALLYKIKEFGMGPI
jgi:two-component system response regulator AtoC